MKYKVTYLAWRKGKKWRLVWHSGGARSERYFATEEEAQAYGEGKAHPARQVPIIRTRKEAKRGVCRALTVDELLDAYLARDGIREITRKAGEQTGVAQYDVSALFTLDSIIDLAAGAGVEDRQAFLRLLLHPDREA